MKRFIPHIGLRTVKTALAVICSMFAASFFGELSIFVPLSAIAVMSRTFSDGLQECRVQAIGITIGGVLGCLTVKLWPNPPILMMGFGVMVIIFLCTSLKVAFSCGLATAIFIVACMSEPTQVFTNTMTRLFHTAIGLLVGLTINYAIVPYDNHKKIYTLLQSFLDHLPPHLESLLFYDLLPEFTDLEQDLAQVANELSIYHRQRFHKKHLHEQEYSYMHGCYQLATRILRELETIKALDHHSQPNARNLARMELIGLVIPSVLPSDGDPTTVLVTNYHLEKLLDARSHLQRLLNEK